VDAVLQAAKVNAKTRATKNPAFRFVGRTFASTTQSISG
jgi:hypothetical protein